MSSLTASAMAKAKPLFRSRVVGLMSAASMLAACGLLMQQALAAPAVQGPRAAPETGAAAFGLTCRLAGSGTNTHRSVQLPFSYRWACAGASRSLNSNGVPDHDVGNFPGPGNPNRIGEVSTQVAYPLHPTLASRATGIVTAGYALNGVKLEPATAGTCDDSGRDCRMARSSNPWQLEALGQTAFNFGTDASNGHVQPTGAYHYHGIPEKLLERLRGGQARMTLVAWAPDGFPIYARYGHQGAADAASALTVLRSSYRLKAAPDPGRPATTQFAMGTFTQDYEYVPGWGDLDECNGRTGVTPEFPNGSYHYVMTETFPFIGRCVRGTPVRLR